MKQDLNQLRAHYRENSRRLALDREIRGALIFAVIYFLFTVAAIIAILF